MHAATSSIGYMHREIFAVVDAEPLSLTQGDIAAKVADLADFIGPIAHPVVQQIRNVIKHGYPQERIVAALELLKETSCTVGLVEQAHASGAVIHRDHKQYTEMVLRIRIMVHQARSLFKPDVIPRAVLNMQSQLQRLQRSRPECASGRQMYLKDMVRQLVHIRDMPKDRRREASRQAFICHAEHYEGLRLEQKFEYEEEAVLHATARSDDIAEQQRELEGRLRKIAADKRQHRAEHGVPNHVASVKFSEEDLAHMAVLMNGPSIARLTISDVPQDTAPRAPGLPFCKAVEDAAVKIPGLSCEIPQWLDMVCQHRERFASVGLRKGPPIYDEPVYLLLFAKQNPIRSKLPGAEAPTHDHARCRRPRCRCHLS